MIPLSVLFIGGHGRSGSTLLSRLLGNHPSAVSVGELMFIGDRGYRDNQLCSCGQRFRACDFWTAVVEHVSAEGSAEDWFARFARLREDLARIRYVPALVASRQRNDTAFSASSTEYVAMLGTLFSAIGAVASTTLIIDSSKYPPYGFFLNKCTTLDLYPVHLIRDSRAVAFSQLRKKVRPEIYWTTELMPRISPARSAFDWTLVNSLMHLLGTVAGRHYEVQYENIVTDPDGVSHELMNWAGADDNTPAHNVFAHSGVEHQLSGNPMRFQRQFAIRPDIEWSSTMSTRDHAVTTAVSAPFLIKYGYKLIPGALGLTPQ